MILEDPETCPSRLDSTYRAPNPLTASFLGVFLETWSRSRDKLLCAYLAADLQRSIVKMFFFWCVSCNKLSFCMGLISRLIVTKPPI